MKKIALIFCCLFFLGGAKLFDASEKVLDNGLRVIVVENNKAPIIKQMLWYNVGAVDEELTAKGSAHFLEHLMFRGSNYNEITEREGIEVNAFTSQDYTTYHAFMDITKLELAMYLEARRMKKLSFSDEEFLVERDVVWQERKQVVENNPMSKFSEAFNKNFWQQNPYAHPITGMDDEIKNLSKEDVVALHEKYYIPNNAVLVLAGNIKPKIAFELAEKYFGDIKPGAKINKKEYGFDYINNGSFKMQIKEIKTPRLVKKYMAKHNSYALDIFSRYLADGKTSYLYQKMVEADKSALEVSSSYHGLAKHGASFSVSLLPLKKDINIDSLIIEALENFDEKKLKSIKQKISASLVYVKDNPEDEAYILGNMASAGLSLEEIEAYEDNIKNINLEMIKSDVLEMLSNTSLQGEVGL